MRVCCASLGGRETSTFQGLGRSGLFEEPIGLWVEARCGGQEGSGQGPQVTARFLVRWPTSRLSLLGWRYTEMPEGTQPSLPSALFSTDYCLLLTTPRKRDWPVFIKWEQ